MPSGHGLAQGQNMPRQQNHAPASSLSTTAHLDPPYATQTASISDDPDVLRGSKSSTTPKDSQSKRPKHRKQSDGRRPSAQSHAKRQENRQGTPVKAAYAGPTFHSSPAPSALPMPSFLSKSLPEVPTTTSRSVPEENESSSESSASRASVNEIESAPVVSSEFAGKEPSPLDFLFDAARQARGTPNPKSPPVLSKTLYPDDDSPSRRAQFTKDLSTMAVPPFELDGSSNDTNDIGPPFATPYQERMNVLRASRSDSPTHSKALDESERKAKTEALKNFLMSPQRTRPASASPSLQEQSNHSDRASLTSLRNGQPGSGPATPVPGRTPARAPVSNGQFASKPFQSDNQVPPPNITNLHASPPPATIAHDPLLSPPRYSPAPSRFPQYQQMQSPPPPTWSNPSSSIPESNTPPRKALTPKVLEDDLRRVLRLGN